MRAELVNKEGRKDDRKKMALKKSSS